jgi:hypothetical protein
MMSSLAVLSTARTRAVVVPHLWIWVVAHGSAHHRSCSCTTHRSSPLRSHDEVNGITIVVLVAGSRGDAPVLKDATHHPVGHHTSSLHLQILSLWGQMTIPDASWCQKPKRYHSWVHRQSRMDKEPMHMPMIQPAGMAPCRKSCGHLMVAVAMTDLCCPPLASPSRTTWRFQKIGGGGEEWI